MTMGERIKRARKEAGLTQRQLAEMIGVKPSAITNYEKDTSRPRSSALRGLINALGMDANYFYGNENAADSRIDIPLSDSECEFIDKYRSLDLRGKELVEAVVNLELRLGTSASAASPKKKGKIIRLYLTPAAAGYASPAAGEDYEELDVGYDSAADYAVRISGDSMEPLLPDGCIAYVSRNADLSDGDVGVFFADGDMLCKQYCIDSRGVLYLFSLNRARADADRSYSPDDSSRVACWGKVILTKKPALPGV